MCGGGWTLGKKKTKCWKILQSKPSVSSSETIVEQWVCNKWKVSSGWEINTSTHANPVTQQLRSSFCGGVVNLSNLEVSAHFKNLFY